MSSLSKTVSSGGAARAPIGVMIVDDSAVIRGLVTRILEAEDDISVVASVGDGARAVKAVQADSDIEVVILDIEMPVMDGLTALPRMLEANPSLKVVMSSTLTLTNADVSLRALSMGAAAYIPKPTSMTGVSGSQEFRRELTDTVRALGDSRRHHAGEPEFVKPKEIAGPGVTGPGVTRPGVTRPGVTRPGVAKAPEQAPDSRPSVYRDKEIVLRESGKMMPLAVAIGSSTGGPQALFDVFKDLGDSIQLPIFITQHMPPKFTMILAERISKVTADRCAEGIDGEKVMDRRIYLAPGDFHMTVSEQKGERTIHLNQDAPENFCRPAVDPMLRSLSAAYGGRVLTVILTGMGTDGYQGSTHIVADGGAVIAQDDETSVVWGMPGAVATGGLCSAVLPLNEIALTIKKLVEGGAS